MSKFTYSHSYVTYCLCEASKKYPDDPFYLMEQFKFKCKVPEHIDGSFLEWKYEYDENHREHIKRINHCKKCNFLK
jgi:hypothetical protein